MLPVLSATSPTLAAHGFRPAFFKPYAPDPSPLPRAPGDAGRCRTSYDVERHGSHADFCSGADFQQYCDEMHENLEFIIARCAQLGMEDAEKIEECFRILSRHRFDEAYFDTHAELIDSAGKRALDNFCAMLGDACLPPERQKTAIRNLSEGVIVCASGTVANLIAADRDLSLSVGGMRGRLWQVKEDTARAVLQQAILKQYGDAGLYNYDDWEIHFVDAIWNHIADAVGLTPVPDRNVPVIDPAFLDSCQDAVFAALSPDRIARKVGEDCLSDFHSRTVFDPASLSAPATADQARWFLDVLDDMRRDLGLTESELSLHAFVRLDADGRRYHVRDDPSLITLELLKIMNAGQLLADVPSLFAEVVDQDGDRVALCTYGPDLAWRLRQSMGSGHAPSWDAQDDLEIMDAGELRAWLATQDSNAVPLPPAAVRQLLRGSAPAELMHVRADCLGTAQGILGLLRRLDPDQAATYLGHNLPYLLSRFPVDERADLIAAAMHMGEAGLVLARDWYSELWLVNRLAPAQAIQYLKDNWAYLLSHIPADRRGDWIDEVMHLGAPGRALARAWYLDPWALLAERNDGRRCTRLEYWMASDNAGAIDAVRELISEGWCIKDNSISQESPASGASGRHDDWAVHDPQNQAVLTCANAIDALRRLFRQLLAAPSAGDHVASGLPMLFPAGVMRIIEAGDVVTLVAILELLLDPLIVPHIARHYPTILLGGGPHRGYPMSRALMSGKPDFVRAYGVLLAHMATVPGIGQWMPGLLMPQWASRATPGRHLAGWHAARQRGDCYALVDASEEGAIDVIRAYHAVLVEPTILPHIRHALPELVLGAPGTQPWSSLQRDVLNRLFDTRSPGYAAYYLMVTDPLILPCILAALPPDAHAIRACLAESDPVAGRNQARASGTIRNRIDRIFQRLGM